MVRHQVGLFRLLGSANYPCSRVWTVVTSVMHATATPDPSPMGPRWLYLHGFASGPGSFKGTAIAAHYQAKGISIERLNLRLPSFEHLRLSVMIDAVRVAIGGPRDRAVLFGSSLGGLTACRVAEDDPRVCALVLLAPAFRMIERWRRWLGDAGWRAWEASGWLPVEDYAEKRMSRVDFGFTLDAEGIDERSGGWPDVRVPVLIVHGKADAVVDIEQEADAFLAGFLGIERG